MNEMLLKTRKAKKKSFNFFVGCPSSVKLEGQAKSDQL